MRVALLYLAAQAAPEIPRELDLDGLQLLSPAQIQAITGLPVTIINKKISHVQMVRSIHEEHSVLVGTDDGVFQPISQSKHRR